MGVEGAWLGVQRPGTPKQHMGVGRLRGGASLRQRAWGRMYSLVVGTILQALSHQSSIVDFSIRPPPPIAYHHHHCNTLFRLQPSFIRLLSWETYSVWFKLINPLWQLRRLLGSLMMFLSRVVIVFLGFSEAGLLDISLSGFSSWMSSVRPKQRLLNRLKASVCRAKGYREMDNHIPKEEDNDINWDTEDELEIQNIVPSSYSTLVTRNSEAIISNEELHLVLLHRIHFMDLQPPHVLIFPFPAQGHVNAMLKLTELLLPAGLHITFLISSKDYRSLCSYATIHSRLNSKPGFRFHVIEGLYEGNMDTGEKISLMVDSLAQVATPLLRKLILDFPVTCVIDDGINGFSLDAVEGTGIPVIFFRTISACAFWAYFSIPELVSSGELPFTGTNMDERIVSVKGMEGFLRRRDLPSFCRSDISNYTFQQVSSKTRQTVNAHALILNTFDDLEGPIVSQIQNHCTNIYTIGPLHAHLKSRSLSVSTSSNSFFKEDKTCIGWLDQQPPKSVLYVSFGSLATLTRDQLLEFWYGLVNSNKLFLWVIREDLVMSKDDENKIPFEVEKGTKERGYLVGWAPQEDVLAHPAVGAFLTHNGWNSTLESIVAGVPMVSWAFFADQQINSRFIDAVWKLGLDMKDTCDRTTVEKIVNEVMEIWKEEFIESANHMAKLAMKSVNKGGSSYSNLDRLIEDIKKMGLNNIN